MAVITTLRPYDRCGRHDGGRDQAALGSLDDADRGCLIGMRMTVPANPVAKTIADPRRAKIAPIAYHPLPPVSVQTSTQRLRPRGP